MPNPPSDRKIEDALRQVKLARILMMRAVRQYEKAQLKLFRLMGQRRDASTRTKRQDS